MRPFARKIAFFNAGFAYISLGALLYGTPLKAQSTLPQPDAASPSGQRGALLQSPASITGIVVDPSGAGLAGAHVTLSHADSSATQETICGDDGQFSFPGVAPGPFQLTVAADGFVTKTVPGMLAHAGENLTAPRIALALAPEKTDVQVVIPRVEIAEEQMKEEEKQRVLGVVPNFYVTYVPDAVPLTSKQKFKLALKATVDPVTFILTGAIAGAQQANNTFAGYGQGAEGYGKRYGADYADAVTDTFISGAILPSLLKQDPRYFYKGTGTVKARLLYAIANAVICKGDNGRWQANYSNILGSLAAGGISNLYYPPEDRSGPALTFENAAVGIGFSAAGNVLQEFVIRRLTPAARKQAPATP